MDDHVDRAEMEAKLEAIIRDSTSSTAVIQAIKQLLVMRGEQPPEHNPFDELVQRK